MKFKESFNKDVIFHLSLRLPTVMKSDLRKLKSTVTINSWFFISERINSGVESYTVINCNSL